MADGHHSFAGWEAVTQAIEKLPLPPDYLDEGQRASLKALGTSLRSHGAVLADEVGMGKTRIAVGMALAVMRCGGRVTVVVPPVVAPQWRDEFRKAGQDLRDILRSLDGLVWEFERHDPPRMDDGVVLISQRLADLRVTEGKRWRADLLHLVAGNNVAQPRQGVRNAADAIDRAARRDGDIRHAVDSIAMQFGSMSKETKQDFANHSEALKLLEASLGLALGPFDLVIIDEAHKMRGDWSKLAALLKRVLLRRSASRTLGLTATPVELDVWQWKSTLARVGMSDDYWNYISPAVMTFRDAATAARQRWRSDASVRQQYAAAARDFEASLAPWVVRRDKRRDRDIEHFMANAPRGASYRRQQLIAVQPETLSPGWRKVVFAAEALSVIGQVAADTASARARLTISNGHGVAGIIDKLVGPDKDDAKSDSAQAMEDRKDNAIELAEENLGKNKRRQRADFWKRVLKAPFVDGDASLYSHPVLMKVVEEIEEITASGEKVLVFGRFTRPMRILTDLLNARALLRAVRDGTPWPHEMTHDQDQKALEVSAGQMGIDYRRADVDEKLHRAYGVFSARRVALRDGLNALLDDNRGQDALLEAIAKSAQRADSIVYLARAIDALLPSGETLTPQALFRALAAVTDALRTGQDGTIDAHTAGRVWPTMHATLEAEHKAPRAAFARMLYGGTPADTRRLLQLAFNRAASEPHVLVAQSMVGREGLNLQEACRIVILLHLEWNPGVVEQQIGRVDRKNSRWAQLMRQDIASGNLHPRQIEIRPVVFRGTYDEHHWSVLSLRWDEQRAQLHGRVVADSDRDTLTPEERHILETLESESPDLWPRPRG
ncbi:hypothetical protein GR220_21795 [Rhizobium leguminosarum]|uniref:helicase-related protein n=1 Tax=Rhizobium ruizarguesonis TaxID=2081791 RepID=UPI0010324F53|nr:helicase-related protein [Rhizobium ruizarguesonis]NEI14612.1 hypothetical protein [Rhizobium ruizarguesonis]TAW76184.1 hypothetical protein ELI10_02555 [Rhizobium ruizarguesonis]TAX13139.1 hypothetical protein ELI09_02560 [Rhizobium ruizarguesonis]TAX17970.1 hypothetical protein ELI08_02550 [Rhizobium ruizarguesonis]